MGNQKPCPINEALCSEYRGPGGCPHHASRRPHSNNSRMLELIDNLRDIGESPTHARRVGRPYTKDCIDSLKISLRLLATQMGRALGSQSDEEYFTGHSDDCDGKCGHGGFSSNSADYCEQYRPCLGSMPYVKSKELRATLEKIAEGDFGANGRCFWCDGWPKNTHRHDCPCGWAQKTLAEVYDK